MTIYRTVILPTVLYWVSNQSYWLLTYQYVLSPTHLRRVEMPLRLSPPEWRCNIPPQHCVKWPKAANGSPWSRMQKRSIWQDVYHIQFWIKVTMTRSEQPITSYVERYLPELCQCTGDGEGRGRGITRGWTNKKDGKGMRGKGTRGIYCHVFEWL
jgi:hypothetical protein